MEFDEWLWRNKVTKKKMAKDLGVHHQTIFNIAMKKRTPTLFTALAIEKYTKGTVSLYELLSLEDTAKLEKLLLY